MTKKFLKITIALILLFSTLANANNLLVSNVSLVGINTTNHYIMVKFDISWENSWRTSSVPNNYDAAWIFVKYRINGGEWLHATLSTIGSDHIAPTGSIIDGVSEGTGIFMYRSTNGTGTNSWTNAQLKWNYGTNGVADVAPNVEVRVIGIEMVYVPQGAFFAGDNATGMYSFKQGSSDNDPWYIFSENTLNVTNSPGSGTGIGTTNAEYYYVQAANAGYYTGYVYSIPISFPKGFKAFYCMKYEITQAQYVEFLNMLTRTQQSARVVSVITTDVITNNYVMRNSTYGYYRNYINCPRTNNGTIQPVIFNTIAPEVPCGFLTWNDGIAYSDWAGLRPMSELEFEKACRGPLASINGEYAWGNASIASLPYNTNNMDNINENIIENYSLTAGNAFYGSTYITSMGYENGPLRAGIFASNPSNTGRITSGSSYYGIMELSGNLQEQVVNAGTSSGCAFTGINGNGTLTISGNADVINWPDNTVDGKGYRGGGMSNYPQFLTTSDRSFSIRTTIIRDYPIGYRSVRCP